MEKELNLKAIIKNTIIGFVLADSLGVPVEFSSRAQLSKSPLTDMIGHGTYNMPIGSWSDDSSMTLITVEVLTSYGINYRKLMDGFIKWYKEGYMTPTDKLFDIGISTSDALNKYLNGIDPLECGGKSEYSNGNGSLMRIYPFIFYILKSSQKCISNKTLEDNLFECNLLEYRKRIIFDASSLTHAHDISKWGCFLLSEYFIKLINGYDKFDAYIELCNEYKDKSHKVYDSLLSKNIHNVERKDIKSTGYVVDTLEAVIHSFLKFDNYKDIVLYSINLGDDTDTVGAITGGLAGMYYKDIPIKWINNLKKIDLINKLIEDFYNKINSLK